MWADQRPKALDLVQIYLIFLLNKDTSFYLSILKLLLSKIWTNNNGDGKILLPIYFI